MAKGLTKFIEDINARAQANPGRAREIMVGAAAQLRRAARNPKNAPSAPVLLGLAEEFEAPAHRASATIEDFDELLDNVHEAAGHADDTEDLAEQREIENKREGGVEILLTPKTLEHGGVIGRSGSFKFDPANEEVHNGITQEQTLIFLPGTRREAQSFTIDSSVTNISPAGPGFSARPFMKVQIGADGFQGLNVECDVGAGQRVTGAGNYVSVALGCEPPEAGLVSSVIAMGVELGFFAATSLAPVTRTRYVDKLAPGGVSPALVRPARAQVLLPVLTSNLTLGDTYQLDFFNINGGFVGRKVFTNTVSPAAPPSAAVNLPNDMASVVVTNTGSIITNFRLIFQLAL